MYSATDPSPTRGLYNPRVQKMQQLGLLVQMDLQIFLQGAADMIPKYSVSALPPSLPPSQYLGE